MNTLTAKDVPSYNDTLELDNGLTLRFEREHDSDHGAPWDNEDGHGPVSDWTTRDKRPGERVMATDRHHKRYYDFAEAVRIAKRDGWDAHPYKTGTKGEQAVRAAEADFDRMQGWSNDRWEYIGVIVTLLGEDGGELGRDSLWGVESDGDYWRETAAEMANTLLAAHSTETEERAHWEARDTVTK